MTKDASDFKTAEPTITFHNGVPYLIRTCSEMIEGRWESFVSMQKVEPLTRRVQ